MLNGLDISTYQGTPNFDTIKSEKDFCLIKATEGVGYTDPEFTHSQSELRRVNMLRGYYHFARPDLNNKPEDEAAWFIQTVSPQTGEILVLDFEVNYSDPVTWCKAWLDHVASLLNGYKPLIYLNLNLVNTHDWTPVINGGYGLYLADYDGITDNTVNTPWPVVAMKQYSSSGQVGGIAGNVDLDTLFGDASTFNAYGYNPTPVPPVPPQPVINDQTEIPINKDSHGYDWGSMQVQAIRSTLGDFKARMDSLNQQITALQEINKSTDPRRQNCPKFG